MRAFAWGGALLFAAALGCFAYQYLITFGTATSGVTPGAIPWNVMLFTGFAIHHSVFARTPVRRWISRYGARYERTIYVWIASLLFLSVCLLWRPVAGTVWAVESPLRWLLYAVQALGVVLTLRGAAVLDALELAGVSQVRLKPDTTTEFPEYKTTGPYGWVRHPIYAGWFLMVLPATPMTMTRLTFAVVSCLYLVIAIPFEERTLRRTSSGAYDAYMKAVRWKLIPGIY